MRPHSAQSDDERQALRETALNFDIKQPRAVVPRRSVPDLSALREHDPVHRMPDGSYFLSRYGDCARSIAIRRHGARTRRSTSVRISARAHSTSITRRASSSTTHLITRRVRKLLAPAFTPRALRALQPRIEALVDRLLDRAAAQATIDLIEDFAAAIPMQLIGDMLGIPADERGPLRDWSLAILGALEPVLNPEQFEPRQRAVDEFKAYLRDLIARRRGTQRRRG